jgi:xylono-1,5-lactonase
MEAVCISDLRSRLGEGTLWDAARDVIWTVDIKSATLDAYEIASGRAHRQSLPHRLTALGLHQAGGLIACGDCGIVRLTIETDLTVRIAETIAVPDERAGNRFNDGAVDPAGRFWAGTMDDAEKEASGCLYRLEGRDLTRVRSGISIPNGPCFLADGTMLATDTALDEIRAFTMDDAGNPSNERIFAGFAGREGHPDGMTLDAEGHVWVAFWDGGCLRRLSPAGRVVAEVPLPVRRPTCPVFGGPDLRDLYVSTASTGLDAETLRREPWSGGLLRLDVGVRGARPHRFGTRDPQSA